MLNTLSFLKRNGFSVAFGSLALVLFYYGWEALGDVVDEVPMADQDLFNSLVEKIESGAELTESEVGEFNRIHEAFCEYAYENARSARMFFFGTLASVGSAFTFNKSNES